MTAILDDVVLSLQREIDRLIRRLRRGAAPDGTHRRLLIVQIDGLWRLVLGRALVSGDMPFLAHLLGHHDYRLAAMSVGLPTSTPAFRLTMMYGVRSDVPGFHYDDRDRRGDIQFPRPGHAAWVEAKQASGRRGILHGGSTFLHRDGAAAHDGMARSGLAPGVRAHRRAAPGVFQRFLNYLDEEFIRNGDPKAHQHNGIRVISAGPSAFLHVLDAPQAVHAEALERRLPGLAEELSRSPGVGFLLARSSNGPVCFRDGIDAPGGHVSFIPERGTHAGPSPEEMHTFILRYRAAA